MGRFAALRGLRKKGDLVIRVRAWSDGRVVTGRSRCGIVQPCNFWVGAAAGRGIVREERCGGSGEEVVVAAPEEVGD